MSKIRTLIEQRPNYYRGQLLLEDDFLAEQNYHVTARRRHNKNLHGWGVVYGLTVSRESATSITVNPGFAVDESGNEIFLEEPKHVDVAKFRPNELLKVSLAYEEASGVEAGAGAPHNRRICYAVVTLSEVSENIAELTLATVRLDGQGRVSEEAVDYSQTRYARIVAPGSITPTELHESLRRGWLRMPFRPHPLVNVPKDGVKDIPPEFRVGPTQALSPDHKGAGEKDRGAAGTMAIPIPPSVKHVTRLRIAGAENEGEILLKLMIGGWDPSKKQHFEEMLVEEKITSAPFMETYNINDTALDPEYQTLSLWLWGTRRTSVSLIAVEFVY